MDRHYILSSSQLQHNIKLINAKINSSSRRITYKYMITVPLSSTKNCYPYIWGSWHNGDNWKNEKQKQFLVQQPSQTEGEPLQRKIRLIKEQPNNNEERKGSVVGAVALIIGTSVGSGILSLPQKTSPAGFLPSSTTMIICWGVLLLEALLLVEINVGLLKKKKEKGTAGDLQVISIRTMAQQTIGEAGGALATLTYVFLGYSSMVAYCSKSGEILLHFINLPESVSISCFIALVTFLIAVGGTRATDEVNQWLTASMIGLLVAIEVVAVAFGGWKGLEGYGNWESIPDIIPVMIFALVYHDIVPVICAYLGGDIVRIRLSIIIGSLVPLIALLIWDAIALGLSSQADNVADPVELLMRIRWGGLSYMVETFSLLAVGTSMIGTLLGFSEFFKEQLNCLSRSSSPQLNEVEQLVALRTWWERNRITVISMALVVVPSSFVSIKAPDASSAATDIAGGYCMTVLYGIFPPAMALAMNEKLGSTEGTMISKMKPAIFCIGLLAFCVVLEQLWHDLFEAHS